MLAALIFPAEGNFGADDRRWGEGQLQVVENNGGVFKRLLFTFLTVSSRCFCR